MGHDPNLEALRKQAANGGQKNVDRLAILVGLALMAVVMLIMVYGAWTSPYPLRFEGNIFTAILLLVGAYMLGAIIVYTVYFGSRTILHITQKFWWVFVLLIIGLVVYLQLK